MAIFADDFLDMMSQSVFVEPFLRRDQYNAPTYGPGKSYRARVNTNSKNILGPDGQMIAVRGEAWLDTAVPMTVDDRVTLPDGTYAKIAVFAASPDENGISACNKFYYQ